MTLTANADEWDITAVDAALDEIAGHLNAQHAQLAEIAVWMRSNVRQWQGEGLWTAEQYLMWRTGIGAPTASKIVDIAERADELPEVVATFRRGELSVDQVAPIARHAPDWADEQIADLATRCTIAQISRIARKYPWGDQHEPDEPDDQADADGDPVDAADAEPDDEPATPNSPADVCWYGYDDNGRFRLHLETTTDAGMTIEAALGEAHDHLFSSGNANVTDLDAFLEVANRSLDSIESPSRRNRHRINLHVNTDGQATTGRGQPLPDVIKQHLSCDGLLTPVFVESGVPVSVGRSQHIVPDRTRRIIEHRDTGCRVPGCAANRFVEVHHIIHWTERGPTDTWNLISLCPHHHRLHHLGRLGITGNADQADGVVFTDANGSVLAESGARPKPPAGQPPPITGTWHHPLGERLESRWLHFSNDPNHPY